MSDRETVHQRDGLAIRALNLKAVQESAGRVAVDGSTTTARGPGVRAPHYANRVHLFAEDESGNNNLDGTVQLWATADGNPTGAVGVSTLIRSFTVTDGVVASPNTIQFGPGVTTWFVQVTRTAGSGSLRVVLSFWRENNACGCS